MNFQLLLLEFLSEIGPSGRRFVFADICLIFVLYLSDICHIYVGYISFGFMIFIRSDISVTVVGVCEFEPVRSQICLCGH